MARDESVPEFHDRPLPKEASFRLPLIVLLVVAAAVMLGIGGLLALTELENDRDAEEPSEASASCQHLYNEIPTNAKRFDPELNAEYRSCVHREYLKKYALLAGPFIGTSIALAATAGGSLLTGRRRTG